MQYREFVKEQMAKMPKDMMAKDKMRKIGEMWRASGHAKGGQFVGAGVSGATKKASKKAPMGKKVMSMEHHLKMAERIPINIAMQLANKL